MQANVAKIWNLPKEVGKNFFYYIKPHCKTWNVWGGKKPTLLPLTSGNYHSPSKKHFEKNLKWHGLIYFFPLDIRAFLLARDAKTGPKYTKRKLKM